MEELLQKAKVRSLSLREIAEEVRERPSLNIETLKKWKVEMAVRAAREFLDEIFQALDSVHIVDEPWEAEVSSILDIRYLRPLIPVALGIALQGGDLFSEIKKLQEGKLGNREAKINEFLSAFRRLAGSVVEQGRDKVQVGAVANLVNEHFSESLPSDLFRRHIAVALADILSLIAAPQEEVENALNEGFRRLAEFYKNTLLSREELLRLGFQTEEQIEIVLTYLPVAAMLQYYVDRLVAGRTHNALVQLAPVLGEVPLKDLNSYFPVFRYIALSPEARKKWTIEDFEESSPYEFLATRGIVTSIGTNVLAVSRGAGLRLIQEMGRLLGVELRLGDWVREATNRNIPTIVLRFLDSLKQVVKFLRDNWSAIKDQIDPNKVPALAEIVKNLGLKEQDEETVKAFLDNKLAELEEIEGIYRGNEELLIRSLPDYITSLSEKLEGALGYKGRDILTKINEALVEIGTYFAGDIQKRLELMSSMVLQSRAIALGGYVEVRLGLTVPPETQEQQVRRKGRRVKGGDPVGWALSELASLMVDGPSALERSVSEPLEGAPEPSQDKELDSYLRWFSRVKAGIELFMTGESVEGEKEYWLHYGINWEKLSEDRRNKKWGSYLGRTSKGWLDYFNQVVQEINEIMNSKEKSEQEKQEMIRMEIRKVHGELQKHVADVWKKQLGGTIVSSFYNRLSNLQADYPEMLAEYIRAARAWALSSRVEVSSLYEEIPGTSGITLADTLAAEARLGIIGRAEELAENIINALVSLVARILGDKERGIQSVRQAFQTGEVREFIEKIKEPLRDYDQLVESIDGILNEIEAGTREWKDLPPSFDMGEFVSTLDEEIDRILEEEEEEVSEPAQPEVSAVAEFEPEVPPELSEEEKKVEEVEPEGSVAEETEEPVEEIREEEEGKIFMKFYLLSKVLPIYSS
jgi:hypothetical protein